MKNNLARALEILWIITSVLCLFAGIHQTYHEGFSKSYLFFIFSFIAFIMYLLRKEIRKSKKENSDG